MAKNFVDLARRVNLVTFLLCVTVRAHVQHKVTMHRGCTEPHAWIV